MKLHEYTADELLKIGGHMLEEYLLRPNTYKAYGRSIDQMFEDRLWGDLAEFAFKRDTNAIDSQLKYEDVLLQNTSLYGINVDGLVEIKTIPRPDSTAATTAIQNYLLKHKAGDRKADFFIVYYVDKINERIVPFGLYRRGFANAIEIIWCMV